MSTTQQPRIASADEAIDTTIEQDVILVARKNLRTGMLLLDPDLHTAEARVIRALGRVAPAKLGTFEFEVYFIDDRKIGTARFHENAQVRVAAQ